MSYKRSRYSSNNQNWLFYHPIVGDNWTHLIQKEYFTPSQSYYEDEDTVIEEEREKQTKLGKKIIILAMTGSTLLLGIAIWLQITKMQKANLNSIEKIEITEKLR